MSYSAGPGGAERVLADHASALGDDTCVASPEGWLADAVRARGLHHFPLRERPLELRGGARERVAAALRLAAHGREVRALAGNLRPRVVVAWSMRSLLACAAVRIDAPLVFHHNDLLPGPTIARAVRAAAARCESVIATSHAIAADLGDPRTKVIHPGVNLELFSPGPPPEQPGVLFLGSRAPWKRPELAREAARIAGLPLTLAGTRADDWLDDPSEAMRAASCLIHCADREPFGLALVEALACGVPVVAPAAGGPTEIVDESCGRLYGPGDAAAAASALSEVVENREALSKGARARAERHFDLRESRRLFRAAVGGPAEPASGEGVAIVTVLHDSEAELDALIDSVERHLPGARLIAVDSGSSDGGPALARARGATVIDAGGNVGFGRGTNAGLAAVTEPVTVVANPDVELLDSSLAALAREVTAGQILAPLIVQSDGSRETSAHPEPASAAEILTAAFPPDALPRRPRAFALPSTSDEPRRVAWAVGACLVARTETLRRLGPFDERTFLFAEDMDLGLRAADRGVETWFRPDARVLHRHSHSTSRAFGDEIYALLARRRSEVVRELRGERRARLDTAVQALAHGGRAAAKTVLGMPSEHERGSLRAVLHTHRDGN